MPVSVSLATQVSSSCPDHLCWHDPIPHVRRHQRQAGADGGPHELAAPAAPPAPFSCTFRAWDQVALLYSALPLVCGFGFGVVLGFVSLLLLMEINFFWFLFAFDSFVFTLRGGEGLRFWLSLGWVAGGVFLCVCVVWFCVLIRFSLKLVFLFREISLGSCTEIKHQGSRRQL